MSSTEIYRKVVEVADRYGSDNSQQFKQLQSKYGKLDPEEVFEGLFEVLCTDEVNDFERHQLAGKLLYSLQPQLSIDVAERIHMTLSSWNRSVEEWPWYLVDMHGKDSVISAIEEIANRTLSAEQEERLNTIRWWIKGYRKERKNDA